MTTTEVIVEFFGVPRLRAGRGEMRIATGTIAEVLKRVEYACPGLGGLMSTDGHVLPHYLLSIDGRRFVTDLAEVIGPDERLLILSADAGG
jgi:sulfur-carrier protein